MDSPKKERERDMETEGFLRKGKVRQKCPSFFIILLLLAMYSSTPLFREDDEGCCGYAQQSLQWSAGEYQNHHLMDAVFDISRSSLLSPKSVSNLTMVGSSPLQFGEMAQQNMSSVDVMPLTMTGAAVDAGRFSVVGLDLENWGDSCTAATSSRTETSADIDADERNQLIRDGPGEIIASKNTFDISKVDNGDQRMVRRLTQNREAARRSRLRKKAYVQQLENSRLKLMQLEQELVRARQQGIFISSGHMTDYSHSIGGGTKSFDTDHARWLDEHQRLMNELRLATSSHGNETELRILVDAVLTHYDEIFRLKTIAVKSDVFHILSGMWITPAERCFMWLGGFRSSELLKILVGHVEPMTEQQLMGICNLQHSSQQAEDALSQGMEALQQSLTETVASGLLYPSSGADNVTSYMSLMATAMGKLTTIENFIRQADLLRQQTLQQMRRILTTRQAARAFLAISDYFSRLRALSSLWLARQRD